MLGGCINNGVRLETDEGHLFFLKWRDDPPPGMYAAEAEGLTALGAAVFRTSGESLHGEANQGGIRTPGVVRVGPKGAWLMLDFIPAGPRGSRTDEDLGRGLAAIHATPTATPKFGWERDNWIGHLPQRNSPNALWGPFWRDARIAPQLELARSQGFFRPTEEDGRKMDQLLGVVDSALDDVKEPALLHGDLWSGNAYADAEGRPVLIDPAAYRGDGEVDLAMTELFGGFGTRFYDAYREARPISSAYHAYRRDLYQLYYLLVHVNLFGASYLAGSLRAVDRVLSEFG